MGWDQVGSVQTTSTHQPNIIPTRELRFRMTLPAQLINRSNHTSSREEISSNSM